MNGWQRLWVVVAVIWVLPVLAISYESWPSTAESISDTDICAQMKPQNARWLVSCYPDDNSAAQYPPRKGDGLLDRLVAENAAKIAAADAAKDKTGSAPPILPPGFFGESGSAASQRADIFDQLANGAKKRPGETSATMLDVVRQLAAEDDVKKNGPSSDIGGRVEKFLKGISQQDMDAAAADYSYSVRRILDHKRVVFVGEAFTGLAVPLAALYALGWAVGWVRRGFRANEVPGV